MIRAVVGVVVLCAFGMVYGQEKAPADEKPISDDTVREDAENEIVADKKYKGKPLLYLVRAMRIYTSKEKGGYVLVGVGASSLSGTDVSGSEFLIKKGDEQAFADVKANSPTAVIVVRAKYTGVAKRPDAYKGFVVQFEETQFVKYNNPPAPKDK